MQLVAGIASGLCFADASPKVNIFADSFRPGSDLDLNSVAPKKRVRVDTVMPAVKKILPLWIGRFCLVRLGPGAGFSTDLIVG